MGWVSLDLRCLHDVHLPELRYKRPLSGYRARRRYNSAAGLVVPGACQKSGRCKHQSSSHVGVTLSGIGQPRPVLSADFDQRSDERDKVAWVRGDQLANVFARRPIKYSGDDLLELILRTSDAVRTVREANRSASSGGAFQWAVEDSNLQPWD